MIYAAPESYILKIPVSGGWEVADSESLQSLNSYCNSMAMG